MINRYTKRQYSCWLWELDICEFSYTVHIDAVRDFGWEQQSCKDSDPNVQGTCSWVSQMASFLTWRNVHTSTYLHVFPGTGWMKIFLRYHDSSMRTKLSQFYQISITCTDLEWNPWHHLRLLKIVQLLDQRWCQVSKLPMFCSWWVPRCLFVCVPSAAQFLEDISWQLSSSRLPYFYWRYIFEDLHWQLPSWWNNGTLTNNPTTTSIQAFICIKGWTLPVMKPVNNVRHLLHQKWSVCMDGVSS